jgi:hypothetical protein
MNTALFVLIMTLITPTGASVATAEIRGKDNCNNAGREWRSSMPARMDTKVYFACVEK